MRNRYAAIVATVLAIAVLPSWSQPGPPASAASMPRQGAGPMHGPQDHSGRDYTPGWPMMSQAERQEHRERMQGFKSYEECKAYMDKHHEQMAARAKERGSKPLPQPRRDATRAQASSIEGNALSSVRLPGKRCDSQWAGACNRVPAPALPG